MAPSPSRGWLCAVLAAAAVVTACQREGSRSFTAPGTVGGPGQLILEGPAQVPPGTTAPFLAFLHRPGAPREDVTRSVTWSTDDAGLATVDAGGRLTAVSVGEVLVEARHEGLMTGRIVRTLPHGTFVVTGTLAPTPGPLRATVSTAGGIGPAQTVLASGFGAYRLAGVGGRVRLTATLDGFPPQVRELDVSADTQQNFAFSPDPASAAWTVTVSPSARCDIQAPSGTTRLRAAVRFEILGGRSAFLTPSAQPAVTFQGELEEDELRLLLAHSEGPFDYYFPGLLMRSDAGAEFEVLMRLTLRREGSGFLGLGSGYIGTPLTGSGTWTMLCDATDHQVSLTPN